jgi:hypothetical protein
LLIDQAPAADALRLADEPVSRSGSGSLREDLTRVRRR